MLRGLFSCDLHKKSDMKGRKFVENTTQSCYAIVTAPYIQPSSSVACGPDDQDVEKGIMPQHGKTLISPLQTSSVILSCLHFLQMGKTCECNSANI